MGYRLRIAPTDHIKRPTIRDVASASGVSPATVSFVLNDNQSQTISPSTRARVLEAAGRLGYTPHGIAKALAEGSSRIVVLNVSSSLPGNYARSFIAGLDDELAKHGYVLLVRHTEALSTDTPVLNAINPKAVLQFGAPYTSGHELEDSGGGWSDGLAAHTATQLSYLADHGHRLIAFAAPDQELPLAKVRLRFSNEVAARLALAPLMTVTVPVERDAARIAIDSLTQLKPRITAVACLDDSTALRVLAALSDLGLKAPDDLAVIGYDDIENGEFSTPSLTTVHIDAEAHGRMRARHALGLDLAGLKPTPGSVLVRESA